MKKIVDKPIKIDLHIHSFFSNHKDGKKVAFNTEENIPVLIAKLICNDLLSSTKFQRSPQTYLIGTEGIWKEPRGISSRHWPL